MPFGPYEYLFRWDRISRDLAARWDLLAESTPHRRLESPLLTDAHFAAAVRAFALPFVPAAPRTLKLDLYNEAFGTGGLADWLRERSRFFAGIDISRAVARRARARRVPAVGPEARLLVGDFRRLPLRSRSFDLVFSFGALEHVREIRPALREAARVLAPGGRLILFVNNLYNVFATPLLNLALSPWLKRYTSFEPAFAPRRVRGWVAAEGFRVLAADAVILLPKPLRYLELAVEGFRLAPLRPLARALAGRGVRAARALERIGPLRRGGEMIALAAERVGYNGEAT